MRTENQKAFIIHIVYYGMLIALLYWFLRYILYAMMPFFLGFLLAFLLRPLIKSLSAWTNGHERVWSTLVILLFYVIISSVIILLFMKGYVFIKQFVEDLPLLYQQYVQPFVNRALGNVESVWKEFDFNGRQAIQSFFDALQNTVYTLISMISKKLVTIITDIAYSLPSLILSFFFAILSSFFFNADFPHIVSFLIRQLPPKQQQIVLAARHCFIDTIRGFIIAYGKLMLLTFVQLVVGLYILGIHHAVEIALLIALFDMFPILGTGGIMIPWILLQLASHQTKAAIGLLIVYLIISLVHTIVEPRILGNQIGLHPLLMLLCMYVGAKLFGVLGILLLPILILVIQNLNKNGLIHLYHS